MKNQIKSRDIVDYICKEYLIVDREEVWEGSDGYKYYVGDDDCLYRLIDRVNINNSNKTYSDKVSWSIILVEGLIVVRHIKEIRSKFQLNEGYSYFIGRNRGTSNYNEYTIDDKGVVYLISAKGKQRLTKKEIGYLLSDEVVPVKKPPYGGVYYCPNALELKGYSVYKWCDKAEDYYRLKQGQIYDSPQEAQRVCQYVRHRVREAIDELL